MSSTLNYPSNLLATGWTASAATQSSAAGTSPDGTNNAVAISEDGTLAAHYIFQTNMGLLDATTYSYGAYLKASNKTWAFLQIYGVSGSSPDVFYNLSTGAVGTADATVTASGIEGVGGGWYWCWFTAPTDTVSTDGALIAPADSDLAVAYQGTTQESILCYGALLQPGTVATSSVSSPGFVGESLLRNQRVNRLNGPWLNDPSYRLGAEDVPTAACEDNKQYNRFL